MLPNKKGYSYTGVQLIYLDDSSDWTDFAEAAISLIDYNPKSQR